MVEIKSKYDLTVNGKNEAGGYFGLLTIVTKMFVLLNWPVALESASLAIVLWFNSRVLKV